MNYSQPLSGNERKTLQSIIRPKPTNKVMNPSEKFSDKIPKTLPIR